MNIKTERVIIDGPAGPLELAIDRPDGTPTGLALAAHPHPLFGGSLDNKVVQTLARAMVGAGLVCVRPNVRGVGASQGEYDHGQGEQLDLWAALDWLEARESGRAGSRRVIGGFSFGAVLCTHLLRAWAERRSGSLGPERAVLVGLAPERVRPSPLPTDPQRIRLIHGEHDEVASLASVMEFIRPSGLSVSVLSGAGHFFHGQLPSLRFLVDLALAPLPTEAR